MPELPEVETVRRGLEPAMTGARIVAVDLRRPDLRFPFPPDFVQVVTDQRIVALSRRAKYLLIHLSNERVLISHLGMSGSYRIERDEQADTPGIFHHARSKNGAHDHVVFLLETDDGARCRVIYNDPRRFGFMLLGDERTLSEHALLADLGVEPTGNSLDATMLGGLFRDKAAPLKAALLDQTLIAGLGNIYVCEALWEARLSPRRAAGTISTKGGGATVRGERLAEAVRAVIARAIAAGGSSLRDYVHADGSLGYFQHSFRVYDREGEPCPREGCSGVVTRVVQSGRSTFYCPVCQR